MMRLFLVFSILFAIGKAQFGGFDNFGSIARTIKKEVTNVATVVPLVSNVKNFEDFLSQIGKNYTSVAERKLRENIFYLHKNLVEANNAAYAVGNNTYELAVNAFADLTNDEFLKQLTGNKKSTIGESRVSQHRQLSKPSFGANIPNSFNWREKGGVTPVKFQGECGSCWSFAVTGAIEGHIYRKTGKLQNLSEQNLIDCGREDFGLVGCDGGFQEYAFEYIATQHGIALGEQYPYLDKKGTCSYKDTIKGAEIKGFIAITPKDENIMKEIIATLGPLACSINGLETLLLYKQGIYSDDECNTGEVNHSILVVGYGSENGHDYWIIKNSWDKVWGENGYFRLPRGKNYCGIASECSYPLV